MGADEARTGLAPGPSDITSKHQRQMLKRIDHNIHLPALGLAPHLPMTTRTVDLSLALPRRRGIEAHR
uniref:Uncharacterized protein n=1 Tax=Mycena chlorophos TaxID=658473 RepID=A0ABQ0LKG5_MYCCL|nr:predicted protein [Mycena chlorophos]